MNLLRRWYLNFLGNLKWKTIVNKFFKFKDKNLETCSTIKEIFKKKWFHQMQKHIQNPTFENKVETHKNCW